MVLELRNLEKIFGSCKALSDVNLALEKGEITAVIGPSGAGKTTLLRCINGLEACSRGSIKIDETYLCKEENGKLKYASRQDMKIIRRRLGMVFQSYNLFPQKTVLENIIEAPVNVYKVSKEQAKKEAYEQLNALGLMDKADFYPFQLSGGQKQRAAIARACALKPSIMCFDEPTAALDPELKEEIATIMRKLAEQGMTILLITHDMTLVKRAADKVVFMEAGKVKQIGTKEDFFTGDVCEKIKSFVLSA